MTRQNTILHRSEARWLTLMAALFLTLVMPGQLLAQGLPEPAIILYGSVTNTVTGAGLTTGTVVLTFTNGASTLTVTAPISNVGGQFLYVAEVAFETVASGLTANPATALPLPSGNTTFGRSAKVDGTNAVILEASGTSFPVNAADRGRQVRVNLQVTPIGAPVILSLTPVSLVLVRTNSSAVQPAAFTVTANNATSYQWSFGGVVLAGETSPTLTIPNARRTNSGTYSVAVTGPAGSVGTNAFLQVVVTQRIQSVQRQADGRMKLLFRDDDGGLPNNLARLEVHSATDLRAPIAWTTNTTGLVVTNGFVQFEEVSPLGGARRFFRIVEK